MNFGDLTNLAEKPLAAMSHVVNTSNSAGRYPCSICGTCLIWFSAANAAKRSVARPVLITGRLSVVRCGSGQNRSRRWHGGAGRVHSGEPRKSSLGESS